VRPHRWLDVAHTSSLKKLPAFPLQNLIAHGSRFAPFLSPTGPSLASRSGASDSARNRNTVDAAAGASGEQCIHTIAPTDGLQLYFVVCGCPNRAANAAMRWPAGHAGFPHADHFGGGSTTSARRCLGAAARRPTHDGVRAT